LNLPASQNTAAATGRQMSTSIPSHSPLLLVALNPDTPSVRPHCTKPLFLTASRVGPARAAWDTHASAMAPSIEAICRFMVATPLLKFERGPHRLVGGAGRMVVRPGRAGPSAS